MFSKIIKSDTRIDILLLIFSSCLWFIYKLNNHWGLVLGGAIFVFISEAIKFTIFRKHQKMVNLIDIAVSLSCVLLIPPSIYAHELIKIVMGISLAVVIVQLIVQISQKHDFSGENSKETD